jgi:ABC-type multidrug transport system ATPase subunit
MKNKLRTKKKNELVDILTRFYVHIIRSDNEIKMNEIDILYPVLTNLFKDLSTSWEVYVKEIMDEDYDVAEVIELLNHNLNSFDKIRVILTMIIMAFSDDDFEIYEISSIQTIAKQFKIEMSGFMDFMRGLELRITAPTRIIDVSSIFQIENSLFTDFLIVGKSERCNLRFKDPSISNIEFVQFEINKEIFIITGVKPNFKLNGNEVRANYIYYLPRHSELELSKLRFTYDFLGRLQQNIDTQDVIHFSKSDYDFRIKCDGNMHSIIVKRGYVYKNGKSISYNKEVQLFWDDKLRIKGYAAFQLSDVIEEKDRIGIDDIVPDIIFLNAENNFYSLAKYENKHTIAQLENRNNEYYFVPLKKNRKFFINGELLETEQKIFLNDDIITILGQKSKKQTDDNVQGNKKQQIKNKVKNQLRNSKKFNFRINNFFEIIEVPFEINNIEITAVKHYYEDKTVGLDNISFTAKKGELIGILGPSGCGKSTLLKSIVAEFKPTHGTIEVDGKGLFDNRSELMQYFGYVPQDDMIFSDLTVFENMYFYGRLRLPNIPQNQLILKIDNILNQVTLAHKRNTKVGDDSNKILSGGQRKRLNIALELLFEPIVLVCDEPTSGLSSFDAEQIIELLHEQRKQNRIVIITVHQPNSLIFKKFSKVLLMDNGGKEVFFGTPTESFKYFQEEINVIKNRRSVLEQKANDMNPDFFYEMILFPEYDKNGKIKFEQVNQQVVTKRRFTPEYWRDKYKRKVLFQLIRKEAGDIGRDDQRQKFKRKMTFFSRTVQFFTYLHRNLVNKLRNRTNLLITFLEAPLLALVVSFILRLAPLSEKYSFYENTNVSLFLFVNIIIFMFFGLTNSINEFLEERKFILREKVRNMKVSHYHISKFMVLTLFTLIQAILYCIISSLILDIRGFFFLNTGYLTLSGVVGISIGLLISSFIHDNKSVINILPLLLIPQIIFAGAVIQFDKMNRNLTIMKKNPIPEVVQFIPSRWLFEGLITGYSTESVNIEQLERINKKVLTLQENSNLSHSDVLDKKYEMQEEINIRYPKEKYSNKDINLIVDIMYGKSLNNNANTFMAPYRKVSDIRMKTAYFNVLIILLYTMIINLFVWIRLKFYYNE